MTALLQSLSPPLSRRMFAMVAAGGMFVDPSFGVVAQAAAPRVQFDAALTAACSDVTAVAGQGLAAGDRLYEAEFRVSMLVTAGSEDDLKELMITINDRERRLRVVDFAPQTEMASDIAGAILRKETLDKTATFDLGIQAALSAGGCELKGTPTAAGHWSKHNVVDETYQKLPPKKLVLASGTLGGGSGVFFKLHPSSQDSLQGAHTFRVLFAAPADWRIGRVTLTCEARGYSKVLFVKQEESAGRAEMTIGLYRAGDVAAQRAAQRLSTSYLPAPISQAAQRRASAARTTLIFQ
ncbi:MAG TPA: hypothetical protein VG713_18365 [Pirellulales bacterium]|nr:hypothetical protein [Pirellulales bacterium]